MKLFQIILVSFNTNLYSDQTGIWNICPFIVAGNGWFSFVQQLLKTNLLELFCSFSFYLMCIDTRVHCTWA